MEFEEHEVTADQDQEDRDSDEEQPAPKLRKTKPDSQIPQQQKKLQIKDKAAMNEAEGNLEYSKITNISEIKNKIRRNEEWVKLKRQKKKEKKARQDERKKEREALGDEAPPKLVPHTIDSMREYDETTVGGKQGTEEDE